MAYSKKNFERGDKLFKKDITYFETEINKRITTLDSWKEAIVAKLKSKGVPVDLYYPDGPNLEQAIQLVNMLEPKPYDANNFANLSFRINYDIEENVNIRLYINVELWGQKMLAFRDPNKNIKEIKDIYGNKLFTKYRDGITYVNVSNANIEGVSMTKTNYTIDIVLKNNNCDLGLELIEFDNPILEITVIGLQGSLDNFINGSTKLINLINSKIEFKNINMYNNPNIEIDENSEIILMDKKGNKIEI